MCLSALRAARASARSRVWQLRAPVAARGPVVIDLDATIVGAHTEKEGATPTWKRTFGFHPPLAFLDHGPGGTGEPVAGLLRTGKATANNAADHITVLTDALTQLPDEHRARVLVRGDSGAGVHAFVHHVRRAKTRTFPTTSRAPDAEHVDSQLGGLADMLGRQFPGRSHTAGRRRGSVGRGAFPAAPGRTSGRPTHRNR